MDIKEIKRALGLSAGSSPSFRRSSAVVSFVTSQLVPDATAIMRFADLIALFIAWSAGDASDTTIAIARDLKASRLHACIRTATFADYTGRVFVGYRRPAGWSPDRFIKELTELDSTRSIKAADLAEAFGEWTDGPAPFPEQLMHSLNAVGYAISHDPMEIPGRRLKVESSEWQRWSQLRVLRVADDLLDMPGLTLRQLLMIARAGVLTRSALADLSADDLVELIPDMFVEAAGGIVMAARRTQQSAKQTKRATRQARETNAVRL